MSELNGSDILQGLHQKVVDSRPEGGNYRDQVNQTELFVQAKNTQEVMLALADYRGTFGKETYPKQLESYAIRQAAVKLIELGDTANGLALLALEIQVDSRNIINSQTEILEQIRQGVFSRG